MFIKNLLCDLKKYALKGHRQHEPLDLDLKGRKIALVVLTGTTKWSRVRLHLERIAASINAAAPGSYAEVPIPFE